MQPLPSTTNSVDSTWQLGFKVENSGEQKNILADNGLKEN